MTTLVEIPDIGDFSDVPVIEVNVAVGDRVEVDDPILMLESDKATLDIPAPVAGIVAEIRVAPGDLVNIGSVVMVISVGAGDTSPPPVGSVSQELDQQAALKSGEQVPVQADVVVIGAGPGGYSAAFRAADLGLSVILIDSSDTLGGVCLNRGCIPSKALLHIAKTMDEAEAAADHGLTFAAPDLDLDKLRSWKDGVVARLTGGLKSLARRRKVTLLQGHARFQSPHTLSVHGLDGETQIGFQSAIVAVGSSPVSLPFLPQDPRIIDSTGALDLDDIPKRLLVLGGGIIGMELGQVYQRFGAEVSVVEMMAQLIPGADADIVAPLFKRVSTRFREVMLSTRVTSVAAHETGLTVSFEKDGKTHQAEYDKILVAVGRSPNGHCIAPEAAGLGVDKAGFIQVNKQMRSNIPHIFAIGDVVGQPMLAHKAVHEAHVAAEVIAGHKASFDAAVIPSVAYCDPEIAWVGLTETQAKAKGIKVQRGLFPWMASGRSLSMGRDDGITKLLFDPDSKRLLGAGIAGQGAGDLIAELALAIEMGADAEDIALTVHPHPTLSETVGLASESFLGTITDL